MAECFWPGVTAQNVADVGERLRQASRTMGSDNRFARYFGAILVPTDEIALVLLEAGSIDAATEIAQRAGVPSERILEIVHLAGSRPRFTEYSSIPERSSDDSSY